MARDLAKDVQLVEHAERKLHSGFEASRHAFMPIYHVGLVHLRQLIASLFEVNKLVLNRIIYA